MSRLGQLDVMSDDLGDAEMRPMQIVSSDQAEHLPVCLRHRACVFMSGMVLSLVAVSVILTLNPSVLLPHGNEPTPRYTVYINLTETEKYFFKSVTESTTNLNQSQSDNGPFQELLNMHSTVNSEYQIEKMCGTREWSYMRFLLSRYDISTTNVAQMDSNTADFVQRMNNDSDLTAALSRALVNHTFMSKLGHDGRVCKEHSSSLYSAMMPVFQEYVTRQLESTLTTTSDEEITEATSVLVSMGEQLINKTHEEVYPYLQSSPPTEGSGDKEHPTPVAEGGTWARQSKEDMLDFLVNYTLVEIKSTPLLINLNGWQIEPVPCAAEKTCPFVSPRDKEFLVIDVASSFTSSEVSLLQPFLDTYVEGSTQVKSANVYIEIHGKLVVGAQTGVVLSGAETTSGVASVTYRTHSLPPHTKGTLSSVPVSSPRQRPRRSCRFTKGMVKLCPADHRAHLSRRPSGPLRSPDKVAGHIENTPHRMILTFSHRTHVQGSVLNDDSELQCTAK